MALGVTGTTFTFQVLFIDAVNAPIVVNDPRITVFKFSMAGAKQPLVDDQPMLVVAGDPGRYRYPYSIDPALPDGDILYAHMSGVDPASGLAMLVEDRVTVIASTKPGGMTTRFVKGG